MEPQGGPGYEKIALQISDPSDMTSDSVRLQFHEIQLRYAVRPPSICTQDPSGIPTLGLRCPKNTLFDPTF
eukprot:145184-Rhodomonas_salina.1